MFRLIKLCAYALFGYALYEFFRGMQEDNQGQGQRFGGGGRALDYTGQGRNRMTGRTGGGREEETADADGGSGRHVVGRGVVS